MSKSQIIDILIKRDNITEEDAGYEFDVVLEDIKYMLDRGDSIFAIEDMFTSSLGLEPDYLEGVLLTLAGGV